MESERTRIMSANIFEKEKERDKERKKQFKLVKRGKSFDLYEHKKYGYKECFLK